MGAPGHAPNEARFFRPGIPAWQGPDVVVGWPTCAAVAPASSTLALDLDAGRWSPRPGGVAELVLFAAAARVAAPRAVARWKKPKTIGLCEAVQGAVAGRELHLDDLAPLLFRLARGLAADAER